MRVVSFRRSRAAEPAVCTDAMSLGRRSSVLTLAAAAAALATLKDGAQATQETTEATGALISALTARSGTVATARVC